MIEKLVSNTELTAQDIAAQLREPEGPIGIEIGLQMNKGNKHINLNSYKTLNPLQGSHVLEIGMGNGFFIKDLLAMSEKLRYTGADYSHIMVKEAIRINKELIDQKRVNIIHASIEDLPFEPNTFDYITTTNTIYFWTQPKLNVKELFRVLKPDGKLLIAYRSKKYLDNLELANHNFTKYTIAEVEKILSVSGFNKVSTQSIEEPDLEFNGQVLQMIGKFTSGIKI